ncbi:MAG: pyrophosphate--fructose-6-phosphate 1-phosphotransferase [Marine Group III euryarchaeote CG-Epi1]|uniref:Pyrophosphate--fructose-6-phosphate 1-phosphotransferase n=1 Tax=Marine Group III euryarchaeote CG-Epi1 TaxID=1888995 RepID=A0A1J5TV24_9ARCH|nr:MAG: pyrophosphate--fructose-6-phosphate 1-phosphotransferase [Marine Group III euryarchaeote CG-Epi1]
MPKVAFLTSGGIAPCLSASIGGLIEKYNELDPNIEMVGYMHGYRGLLLGKSVIFSNEVKKNYQVLYDFGGSPIGNSRVKLTNVEDCIKKGFVKEGENPLDVAAKQLEKDEIDILHTIGGDDTNTMAAALAKHLEKSGKSLTVVGLPKTVDNDVIPVKQTLGAWTAAEQGARFFQNIVNENTTSRRQLIIHEVMGRHCGWLTAGTALEYRKLLDKNEYLPELFISKKRWDVHAVYIPEKNIDFKSESVRLREIMDENDCVNIFLSEGAGMDTIVREIESRGESVPRDAFGHVRLDDINPGQWFAKQFSEALDADKTLIQKSGYFARSAKPGSRDLELIKESAFMAAELAINGQSGLVGLDENNSGNLGLIDLQLIKGGKDFDTSQPWFVELLLEIGQE